MRLGIDFGGTKTEIIALDARNGKELYRHRIPTTKNDYKKTIKNFVSLIEGAEKSLGKKGTIGLAMPGSLSPSTGLVRNSNALWMNDQPLKKDLEAALGGREVRIENDANCFVVSEATDGAAKGKDVVFGVIIGTGCGGGFYINGRVVTGANAIGGEWGHNPLPFQRVYAPNGLENPFTLSKHKEKKGRPVYVTDDIAWAEYPGEVSYCGRRGMLEEWISGTGFKMDYHRVTGEELSTHDIIENANRGEEKAVAALERYCDRLARGLAYVINMLDPHVIVLGGGMSNVEYLYKRVPEIWSEYIFSDVILTQLKPPRHGDSSGVRGAAWLWPKE